MSLLKGYESTAFDHSFDQNFIGRRRHATERWQDIVCILSVDEVVVCVSTRASLYIKSTAANGSSSRICTLSVQARGISVTSVLLVSTSVLLVS